MRRLARISQLGLVAMVYPGATPSRLEHSLGVYRLALEFLARLRSDPTFTDAIDEHDAAAFVAVVEQHIEAECGQFIMQFLRSFAHCRTLANADGHDGDIEGRDRLRPDDAALVVVLLDGGGDDARNADAVAAHFHRLLRAFFIEVGAFERG